MLKTKLVIMIITTLVLLSAFTIYLQMNKTKSIYSDLVSEFYNEKPISYIYSYYNSSQPNALQPQLVVDDSDVKDVFSRIFLKELYYSSKSNVDPSKVKLKSLGILDVSYLGMTKSFVRLSAEDDSVYFKHINNRDKLVYATYYKGMEEEIVTFLGKDNWYSFSDK